MIQLATEMAIRGSLPSRGARIEIEALKSAQQQAKAVAPLAGSADRNCAVTGRMGTPSASLPSRGARIEIFVICRKPHLQQVAPLAGSVDRNLLAWFNPP